MESQASFLTSGASYGSLFVCSDELMAWDCLWESLVPQSGVLSRSDLPEPEACSPPPVPML